MADPNETTSNPKNELEYLIEGGRKDLVSIGTLYQVLLRSQVHVLCNKEWDGKTVDNEMKTLVMKPDDGTADFLPVFTTPLRAGLAMSKYPDYPFLNKAPAALALALCGGKTGLAINPGSLFDLQITPQGIDQLKAAFGPKMTPPAS
jgi:hypothetical protein